MTIWILALVLFGVVGALGRQVGGIRMGISLLGVIVALFVAGPLAPHVRTALGAVGFKNPVTVWSLAAPLAFLGVMLVFNSIAMAVYVKISGYYKFRATDDVRMRWERIDNGLGLSAGLLAAVVYLVAASAYIFHVGYVTAQVESPTDNPVWLKVVNKLRADLSGTKFDRVAAGVGQASPAFFQTADALGLLYHNPDLQARLPDYPLFMSLAEQGDLQGVFTNELYAVLLPARTNISLILKDPGTKQVIANGEVQRVMAELDLADLLNFLRTGGSEKYAKEPLVGKWQLDINSTVRQYAQANPKTTVVNQNRLRALLRYRMSDYVLLSTPDEKLYVKGAQKPIGNFTAVLGTLFTIPPQAANPEGKPPTLTLAQGSWKKEGDKYQLSVQSEQGEKTAEVSLTGGKLAVPIGNNTLVFAKVN